MKNHQNENPIDTLAASLAKFEKAEADAAKAKAEHEATRIAAYELRRPLDLKCQARREHRETVNRVKGKREVLSARVTEFAEYMAAVVANENSGTNWHHYMSLRPDLWHAEQMRNLCDTWLAENEPKLAEMDADILREADSKGLRHLIGD